MTDYLLRCPHCGARVDVDASVRDLLLREGCPVCGRALSVTAFDVL